ncbi:FAD-dependent oxidoreductase [Lysinibacillus sp. C5.1]|uniref:FAD-dependent oxidoreductase n=1 Tax=Lysinibacillus sp. C5.1 TaxID=2796169 RepID=UPI00308143BE
MSNVNFDTIIVGNGAIGSSIAYELSSRGQKVALIGKEARESAASTAAGAMNGCYGEVTESLMKSEFGRKKLLMDIKAKNMWEGWLSKLTKDSGDEREVIIAHGTEVILNTAGTRDVDSVNFMKIEQALKENSERYEIIDSDNHVWLKADEQVRPLKALLIPEENAVDPNILLAKLSKAIHNLGGTLFNEHALSVITEGNQVCGIELSEQKIFAKNIIIAAGVHSLDLLDFDLELKNKIPPMFSGYGVSILLELDDIENYNRVIRTPNRAFACGLHCVPRNGKELYIGATNILSDIPRKNAYVSDVQFLLDCAVEQLHLDLFNADIKKIQVGNRPIPADGFPLIGQIKYDGLWLATGTYRDGLHQSPLIAEHLANEISGIVNDIDLSDFHPIRKPLYNTPRHELIAKTTSEMFATGYEYRWDVQPYWHPILEKGMLHSFEEILDELHKEFAPPPEILSLYLTHPKSSKEQLRTYYNAWSE